MESVTCVKVPQRYAQVYREHLQSAGVLDQRFCLQKQSDGTISLPVLLSALPKLDLMSLQRAVPPDSSYELVQVQLSKKTKVKSQSDRIEEVMQKLLVSHGLHWDDHLTMDIPQSWQRHGDLILFGQGCFSNAIWKNLGTEMWSAVAGALGVKRLAQIKRISADGFRTPVVTVLLGESSHVTHTDNRIRYEFDISKCMFSFGNISEKLRIASFNCKGETVVDLYAGIGYFTLPYLVHAGAAHVHACEWNPNAVEALHRNLQLNGVSDHCTIHQGDNRQLALCDLADRVNLGLIPSSEGGWPVACRLLKRKTGGILHIHHNVTSAPHHAHQTASDTTDMEDEDNLPQRANRNAWEAWANDTATFIAALLRDITGGPWRTCIQHIEKVKSYAPHVDHVVLDLECRPDD
ncbi:tRNA wybutosine-synthesizing protein 2 homolog [Denticeps clupeoides]|uniref:tRNA wybutosine-synthesizing protein 2 homolog n=1 Tax=Denticeps clupeoides TaxID=299321 RepID=A0AAY4C092_9TELE|nr:tRNA wybutosine-synthesizing protein 2 homolog [Denticeps clupeoides]